MEKKPWYASKGVWTGIVTLLIGIWESLNPLLGTHLPPIPTVIIAVLGALGIYSRVNATTRIG
jgi:hypothetical protein